MTKTEKFIRSKGGQKLWDKYVYNFHHCKGEVGNPEHETIDDFLKQAGNSYYSGIGSAFEWIETDDPGLWSDLHEEFISYDANIKRK
jgi:hypothetical protein